MHPVMHLALVAALLAAAAGTSAAQSAQPTPVPGGLAPWTGLAVWLTLSLIALTALWKLDAVRPGSLERANRRRDPIASTSVLPLLMLAFGVFLLPQLVGGAVLAPLSRAFGVDFDAGGLDAAGLAAGVIYGLGIAAGWIACYAVIRWKLMPRPSVEFRFRHAWVGLIALTLAYPAVALAGNIARLLADSGSGSLQHGTLNALVEAGAANPWWWLVLAGAVLGAPIFEEVVFRGLLQPALAALIGRWPGLLITAAIFTFLHIPSGPGSSGATWLAIPTLAVLAIALGIARERTGSLGVAITMHIGFNALNVGLAFAVT